MVEEQEDIKRGKGGGRWHGKPGKGHARKSQPVKKRRIAKSLKNRHKDRKEAAEKKKEELEQLSPDAQRILQRPKVKPSSRSKNK